MTLTLIIVIYLVGAVLAYGRMNAAVAVNGQKRFHIVQCILLSLAMWWLMLPLGTLAYFIDKHPRFLLYRDPKRKFKLPAPVNLVETRKRVLASIAPPEPVYNDEFFSKRIADAKDPHIWR